MSCGEPKLSREETEEFISRVLCIDLPSCYPPSLDWINRLIQAFQRNVPFQNVSFLSKESHKAVPTWEEIHKEVIVEGKGGLCLSLNIAFAAVLSSLGTTAYNAAADYVATNARGVHAVSIILFSDVSNVSKPSHEHSKSNIITRSKSGNLRKAYYNCEGFGRICKVPNNCVYLVDVGCGYPTLQAINLKEDLGKVFNDCGLEYCLIKKGQRYVRMHRRGHDLDEVEKKCLNSKGWLPVFSFRNVPQPFSFFQCSMRDIYVNKMTSPYFSELHAIRYFSQKEMIAVKNEELIKYLGEATEENIADAPSKSDDGCAEKVMQFKNRVKLKLSELIEELHKNFPMIPRFYPIGESVQRLPQKDLVLGGYHIPAGTYVDLNPYVWLQSEQYFKRAKSFQPERWLREAGVGPLVDPYILNPFSIGTRMCAGRRFAEQDLYVGMCRLLQKFRIEATSYEPPEQEWRILLRPKTPLPIRFLPRE